MKKKKKSLIYLIGQPGSGKSTVTAELFKGLSGEARAEPIAHIVYPRSIQIGANRESFSGTDALPMNIQPKVVPFILESDCDLFFAEGDRLANDKFFTACAAAGISPFIFLLNTPNEIAAERRRKRGSKQSQTWLKGRITKVFRLWREWGSQDRLLIGTLKPDQIVESFLDHAIVRRAIMR